MAARNQKKNQQPQNRVQTTLAVLTAAVVVASLAFVSFEAALLGAGFFVAAGFVMADIKRRRFWENGLTFRMKGLSDNHRSLEQKITGTRQDLLNLRQQIADMHRRVGDQDERLGNLESHAPARPAAGRTALIDEALPQQFKGRRPANNPAMPSATRPGQKPAPQPMAPRGAPDEDYSDLSDMVVRELITHAVRARNIDIFVQPIVRLPQRRVRFYEMYARVRARPGMYLPARRYMHLAQEGQLTGEIDNMILTECLKTIRASSHVERAAPLFINISASTLANTVFLKRLVGFIAENRPLAPRLIFEMVHAQYKTLQPASRELLRGLGKLGCSVSLDHVEVMEFDIAELQKYHVRFVKIAAKTLLPYTRSDRGRADLQKQKRRLESNGVSVIVEKVETENDLLELLDFDFAYGQGHLFGRPDLEAAYRKRRAA